MHAEPHANAIDEAQHQQVDEAAGQWAEDGTRACGIGGAIDNGADPVYDGSQPGMK